ncbi:MAG: hypothetical protein O7G84_00975 [Gammaproteobacteria bacterium]|nr:hypothetical protein [Gammaproteobacteria bacterium]
MENRTATEEDRFYVHPSDRGAQGDGATIHDRHRGDVRFAECAPEKADWQCAAFNAHHKRDQESEA